MNVKQTITIILAVYILYSIFVAERRSDDMNLDDDTLARKSRSIFSWIDIAIGVGIAAVIMRYAIKIF